MPVECLLRAAECRHIHVVRWLHEHGGVHITKEVTWVVADNGDTEMMQYLHARACELSPQISMRAAQQGHTELVQLLTSWGCPPPN